MKERDYIADLKKALENAKPGDQLRQLEKIETFCRAACEKLKSHRAEGHFNEFLENN